MPGLYQRRRLRSRGLRGRRGRARRACCRAATSRAGDVVLGLASSGVHSNGFSLVRKVVARIQAEVERACPFDTQGTLGEAMLTPTRIYVQVAASPRSARPSAVKALAHITGGGFPDNIPRVLPKSSGARIDLGARAGAAGVPMARRDRRHRREGNAAHLQLRHRHDRGGRARARPTRSPSVLEARRRDGGAARRGRRAPPRASRA